MYYFFVHILGPFELCKMAEISEKKDYEDSIRL